MDKLSLKEYRCECGKLLFKGSLGTAIIEIKCRRCEKINFFEGNFPEKMMTSIAMKINAGDLAKPDNLES